MNLFYITASRLNLSLTQSAVILTEELSSEYESSCIDVELSFCDKPDLSYHKTKIALFTSEEIDLLLKVKNKQIAWGSKEELKGMNVRHFERLFDYVENVEVKQVELKP